MVYKFLTQKWTARPYVNSMDRIQQQIQIPERILSNISWSDFVITYIPRMGSIIDDPH